MALEAFSSAAMETEKEDGNLAEGFVGGIEGGKEH